MADAGHLTAILADLYDNPRCRRQHRDAGLAYVQHLDWRIVAAEWAQLLDDAVTAR